MIWLFSIIGFGYLATLTRLLGIIIIIGIGMVIRYLVHNLVTRVSYIVLVHNGGILVLVHSGGVLVLDHNGGVLVVVPSGGVWG